MASIAVCSNSITALLTADASYESLPILSCKLLEVRARAYKQSNNVENVCRINERKFPNVFPVPVTGCATVYKEYLQYVFNIFITRLPGLPPPALPFVHKEHGRKM